MKRLSVVAFLAALGLLVAGCGGGGSSSSVKKPVITDGSTPNVTVGTNEAGFTTETKFINPETGAVVSQISAISSSATGSTPPRAPSFARTSGTAVSVSTK